MNSHVGTVQLSKTCFKLLELETHRAFGVSFSPRFQSYFQYRFGGS